MIYKLNAFVEVYIVAITKWIKNETYYYFSKRKVYYYFPVIILRSFNYKDIEVDRKNRYL